MSERLRAAFQQQAAACASLGSPFMARLCALLAVRLDPDGPVTRRLFDWPGDVSARGESLPLRLAGALHALVLQGHPGLAAVYPPHEASDEALWSAVQAALQAEAGFIGRFIDSVPQTNEVRRAAVLVAAGHWLAARHPLPFVLSELGASAGLNLNWDRFALGRLGPAEPVLTLTPDWQGQPPAAADVRIAGRAGVDLNPIDVGDPQARLRLLTYLWPDQPERRALTLAAIEAGPPLPARADAIDWLRPRLAEPMGGRLHLIWTTIAWQYFPPAKQAEGAAMIAAAGARASAEAPLAWLAFEGDGQEPGAAISLRLWPGDQCIDLGRADYHGRWVDWRAP